MSVSGHIVSVSGHIVSWPFEVASSEHFGLELHFNMAAMIVYTKVHTILNNIRKYNYVANHRMFSKVSHRFPDDLILQIDAL